MKDANSYLYTYTVESAYIVSLGIESNSTNIEKYKLTG